MKLIGLSANGLADHEKWVKDINEWGSKFGPTDVQYPIVRPVSSLHCTHSQQAILNDFLYASA